MSPNQRMRLQREKKAAEGCDEVRAGLRPVPSSSTELEGQVRCWKLEEEPVMVMTWHEP